MIPGCRYAGPKHGGGSLRIEDSFNSRCRRWKSGRAHVRATALGSENRNVSGSRTGTEAGIGDGKGHRRKITRCLLCKTQVLISQTV